MAASVGSPGFHADVRKVVSDMHPAKLHVLGGLALCAALCSCGSPPSSAPLLSSFSVAPSSVVSGVPTTVTWSFRFENVPNPAPACTIDGVGPVTDGIQSTLTLTADTTFTLSCSNSAGTATADVSITATPVPVGPAISGFAASPSSVAVGAPTSVKWTWTYSVAPTPAPVCSIDQGVGTVTNATSTTVTLSADTTFTLTCTNSGGTDSRSVTVLATPPVAPAINTFVATPGSVVSGASTSITWTWTYSNSPSPVPTCSIDQGIGTLTSGTARDVTLTAETVFTLTCTNAAGSSTRQVTVTLTTASAPVIATFTASPSAVPSGVPTNIQWNWTYSNTPNPAPSCSIDQGVGGVTSGQMTMVTLSAAQTYTLTCTNVGGSGTAQATITIAPAGAPVIATFTASPPSVQSGIPTSIQWSWTYAGTPNPTPSCSIDQGVGGVTNGQMTTVTLSAARTYTLTCTNSGGSGTAQTTINLAPINSIINGGFESGNLNGWTTAGTTARVTGGHSGTYAARTGSTAPTNGDSSVSQTFTASAGATQISFWYMIVCPDTVNYAWATATLRNNSTSVTSTVLAPVCTDTGLWQQVTAPVSAGTSYTLTLINHDDGLVVDPTYTLYDDVTLQ